MPTIISVLGREYPNDPDSVWISIGIFFDILVAIEIKRIKSISQEEISSLLQFFRDNCVIYALKGFLEKSFYRLYPDIKRQEALLSLFVTVAGDKKYYALVVYLIESDFIDESQIELVYRMLQRNEYNFGHLVFSQVCFEIVHEKLTDNPADKRLSWKLYLLFKFALSRKLLSKSEILLLKRAILHKKVD